VWVSVAVCHDPDRNGNIVAKLTHVLAGTPADNNGNDKGRKDHGYAQWPPKHAPAYIFKKPENNVQVFHFTIADGDVVGLFVCHVSTYEL
jgi:hypothetical protein